jgi:hypothetical protein
MWAKQHAAQCRDGHGTARRAERRQTARIFSVAHSIRAWHALKSLPEGKALWLIIRCGRWRMFADRKYCPMDSANEKR